jgi:FlaA1/EpsC-like NDP-sugar epimerase
MFKDRTILIDGGSGSWGNELTQQLLNREAKKIIIYSRGEIAQVAMQRKFNNPSIEYVIGDIRDADAVDKVCKDIDYIFHCFPDGTKVICDRS